MYNGESFNLMSGMISERQSEDFAIQFVIHDCILVKKSEKVDVVQSEESEEEPEEVISD